MPIFIPLSKTYVHKLDHNKQVNKHNAKQLNKQCVEMQIKAQRNADNACLLRKLRLAYRS